MIMESSEGNQPDPGVSFVKGDKVSIPSFSISIDKQGNLLTIYTTYWCATRAQVTNGYKSRRGNCRFTLVATQTVEQGDLPAEALGTNLSL